MGFTSDKNNCLTEEHAKWWFSATDIVRAINNEDDYTKSRNYWKYLKGKLQKAGFQLVNATNQFKFEAPDGKMRTGDVLDAEGVQIVAKNYPNNRASAFLDWFVYSDKVLTDKARKRLIHL